MSEKLSYEEWKNKFITVVPTKDAREDLGLSVNVARELENVLMEEYEFYVGGGYDQNPPTEKIKITL
jgi:hypothetical protein